MMIKRILVFMLTVFVLSSCIIGSGAAAFAASSTAEAEKYSIAAELLFALDIFGESDEVSKESPVKRGEFCGFMADILKLSENQNIVGYYKDVNEETKYAGAIEGLFIINALSSADDGRFYPNRNITMNEALKILLAATGYQEKALTTGGVYNGYYMLAKKLDLLDGLSYDGNRQINKGEVAVLLKNFLRMQMFEISSLTVSTDGNINLGKETGETVIEKYFNIAYFEDVVNANRYTSLLSQTGTDENKVMVGDMILKTGGTDISKKLGYRVEVYYDIDKEEIVYYNISDKNTVVEIAAYDEPLLIGNELYYYSKNGKKLDKSIPADAAIIYNNLSVSVFKEEYFDIDNGKIILIDSEGNGVYETVIINDYQTVVVNYFNEEFDIISTKNNSVTINLADKEYEIYDENGKRINESYIVEWDVLNVLNPDGNGIVVIYMTRNQVSGKIKSISDEYITVDNGEKYMMIDGFYEENSAILKPGARGVLYLDIMGYVASFRLQDDNSGLGYIIKWAPKSAIDEAVEVRMLLYNPDDSQKMCYTFETQDKIKVDGSSIEAEKLGAYLQHIKDEGKQLIVNYKVNADGEISEIDTVILGSNEDADYTLCEDYAADESEAKSMAYQQKARVFSGKVVMESDAVLFYVPPEPKSESEYGAVKINLPNKKNHPSFITYKIGADKMAADALVFNAAYGKKEEYYVDYERVAYIDGIWEEWNPEDNTTHFIVGYYRSGTYQERKLSKEEGIKYTVIVDKGTENEREVTTELHAGDLVLVSIDPQGEINTYTLLYDFNNKSIAQPAYEGANYNYASYHEKERTYVGYVYELEGDTVALSSRKPAELVAEAKASLSIRYGDNEIPASVLKTEVLKNCDKFNLPSSIRKYENDRENGWTSCSTTDILPYTLYGDSCSKMFMFTTYSYTYDAAIIE